MIYENTITLSMKSWLEKKVEKVNRRCKKIGIEPLVLTFENQRVIKHKTRIGMVARQEVIIDAKIEGEEPKIEGWELISVFQKEKDIVLTRTAPGKEIPKELYPETIRCQHCNKNVFRKQSVLLKNVETGEYKEVGTSCVKDFCGYRPDVWLDWARFADTDYWTPPEDYTPYVSDNHYAYDLMDYLSISVAVINVHGWVSKSNAEKWDRTASVYKINRQIDFSEGKYRPSPSSNFVPIKPTEDDTNFAKEAVEHFKNLTEDSEYVINIQKMIQLDYVPIFQTGLAASIIGSYKYHLKKNENALKETSKWIGEIKERFTFEATVVGMSEYEGYMGNLACVYTFKDDAGNIFKWFTAPGLAELNEKLSVAGTVKKHSEYNGQKQTVLTRCKLKNILPEGEHDIYEIWKEDGQWNLQLQDERKGFKLKKEAKEHLIKVLNGWV